MFRNVRRMLAALLCCALTFFFVAGRAQSQPAGKRTLPLQMRLIAKQDTYVLDLGGKSPDEFRKILGAINPLRPSNNVPPGPKVDLVLEITNPSDQDVTIWIGGEETALTFNLEGPGAVSQLITLMTTADLKFSHPVVIRAGRTYTQPITSLDFPSPRPNSRWYWLRRGDYRLSATWRLGGLAVPNAQGGSKQTAGTVLVTAPIKLKVIAPQAQAADYLTPSGQLKERIEIQETQSGFVGVSGSYVAIETDGSWSSGTLLFLQGKLQRSPTAKGKLTTAQVKQLAEVFARHQLAELSNHGVVVVNPHSLTIKFGQKTFTLEQGPGQVSPAADKAMRDRYQGIVAAVGAVCRPVSVSHWRGLRTALADIEAGRLKWKSLPLPSPAWHGRYVELLKKELGVDIEVVTATTTEEALAEMNGYNDLMRVEIEHRFGAGAMNRLGQQAQREHLENIKVRPLVVGC
jgi:hypothetical protein